MHRGTCRIDMPLAGHQKGMKWSVMNCHSSAAPGGRRIYVQWGEGREAAVPYPSQRRILTVFRVTVKEAVSRKTYSQAGDVDIQNLGRSRIGCLVGVACCRLRFRL